MTEVSTIRVSEWDNLIPPANAGGTDSDYSRSQIAKVRTGSDSDRVRTIRVSGWGNLIPPADAGGPDSDTRSTRSLPLPVLTSVPNLLEEIAFLWARKN